MKVNVLKTRAFYQSLSEDYLCGCAYCQSYRMQVKSAYPRIAAHLETLGVDVEMPFELIFFDSDENGMLDYIGCQYIVFGSCDDAFYAEIDRVPFCKAEFHPSTEIGDEHFVLDFGPIKLKSPGGT